MPKYSLDSQLDFIILPLKERLARTPNMEEIAENFGPLFKDYYRPGNNCNWEENFDDCRIKQITYSPDVAHEQSIPPNDRSFDKKNTCSSSSSIIEFDEYLSSNQTVWTPHELSPNPFQIRPFTPKSPIQTGNSPQSKAFRFSKLYNVSFLSPANFSSADVKRDL